MKNLIVVFLFAGLSFGLSAQNDIQFGFQLSPTMSWLTTNDSKINSNGPNLGLQLGMIGEYYFRENYSLATGIGFQRSISSNPCRVHCPRLRPSRRTG